MQERINKFIALDLPNDFNSPDEAEYRKLVSATDIENLIQACDADQVKALWKFEQIECWDSLEDRLVDLLGDDAWDWIEGQD